LLEIDPPDIRVRDLGSRNGTFVNGESIGQRSEVESPDEIDPRAFPERGLHDGDELKVGHTVFRVQITEPKGA
jgi:pSer/pThr/pTyr-binding forkhead associated (FHA) protein